MNLHIKHLYNKYKNKLAHLHSLERKQFRLEQHLQENPTDYISVVRNEVLKSDIQRAEYEKKQLEREMEYYGEA